MKIISLVLACFLIAAVTCRAQEGAMDQYLDNYHQAQDKINELLDNFESSSPYPDLSNKMNDIKSEFNDANQDIILNDMNQLDIDVNEYMNKLIDLFKDYENTKTKNDSLLREAKGLKAKVQDDINDLPEGY